MYRGNKIEQNKTLFPPGRKALRRKIETVRTEQTQPKKTQSMITTKVHTTKQDQKTYSQTARNGYLS